MTWSGLLLLWILATADAGTPALVAQGDADFVRIDYPAAITAYQAALQETPDNPDVLWRLARVYVCLGEVQRDPESGECFRKAGSYARDCIRVDSTLAEGHTWLAGALGYLALRAGMREQIELSHELIGEVDVALKIDPADDAALSIKGSFYRALGNVGWLRREFASVFVGDVPRGGYEEAEAALLQAIALAPDIMRHPYELGVLYMDWGRKEEAKQQLERAARLPVRVAIDRERLEKIRELLSEL